MDQISISTIFKKDWYYAAQLRTTIIQNLEKNNFHKRVKCSRSFNFGAKTLSPDILQDYQYAGAIHILSVSGLHVGFLLFLTFILKPIPNTKGSL
jgi:competence protein ComEC